MKKQLTIVSILFALTLMGCTIDMENDFSNESQLQYNDLVNEIEIETVTEVAAPSAMLETASYEYLNFEEAVLESATHIVVAQYVGSRPFGDENTEFEFIVIDEILGETTERIFVFVTHMHAHVSGHVYEVEFVPGDLSFELGVDYLLPLINTDSVDSIVERDGDQFAFVRQIVIDLDDPSNSMMYSEYLDDHIEGIDLDETTSAEEIISFVEELAEEIEAEGRPEILIIDSADMTEILIGSPHIWIVEINGAWRLSHEQSVTTWVSNDIYYANVVEVLKGDAIINEEWLVVFPPDSVFTGERHIVAVVNNFPEASFYDLTSRYGLFSMDQLEEIREILTTE